MLIASSLIAGNAIADHLIALTRLYLSPTGQELLAEAITDATGWAGSSIIGLAVLLWSAFRVFLGIDIAFAQLYGSQASKSLTYRLRDGVTGLVAIAFALFAAAAAAAMAALIPVPYLDVLSPLFLVFGLVIVFLPVYYVFPDVDITVREAVPGTLVAAVGWAALQSLFQLYISITTLADVFGVIGGALLFLLWLYFSALVLLLGVVVNVVLAGRSDGSSATETAPTGR